jgi:hypothetical protein
MKYWAVGVNLEYSIIKLEDGEFPPLDYTSAKGPFDKLGEAKNTVRKWIASDRWDLQVQLRDINRITEKTFK